MDQRELLEILNCLINRCIETDFEYGDPSMGRTDRNYHLSSHNFNDGVTCFWLERSDSRAGSLNLTADGWRVQVRYRRDLDTHVTIRATEEAMVAARLGGYI